MKYIDLNYDPLKGDYSPVVTSDIDKAAFFNSAIEAETVYSYLVYPRLIGVSCEPREFTEPDSEHTYWRLQANVCESCDCERYSKLYLLPCSGGACGEIWACAEHFREHLLIGCDGKPCHDCFQIFSDRHPQGVVVLFEHHQGELAKLNAYRKAQLSALIAEQQRIADLVYQDSLRERGITEEQHLVEVMGWCDRQD
jgi:hypothetical protein